MKTDWKKWTTFMLEVCEKIHDPKDKSLVEKRLTKKMYMLGKILEAEIKEIASLKKIKK